MCKTTTKEFEVTETGKKKPYIASVEEALSMTGFGKYNFGLLLVCSWTLQAMGMDMFGTSFVVAAAVCDLELTLQQRALLTAMPLLGVVAGAQLWGYVSDTKGRRLTLVLSMSIGFVFAALSSFSPNWQTMAILKLISSTFTSASNSGAYTLLGESCSERARGRAMLLCTCALMCSQATVAAFAYPILPLGFAFHIDFLGITYRPWRLLALVMSLPCAATACLLQLFHESPKFLASHGRLEEALEVLKKIYASNTGNTADSFPVKKLLEDTENQSTEAKVSFFKSVWQQTVPLFRAPLLKETVRLFYLVAVIYMTGSGFILWLPYIMNNLFFVLEAGGGEGMNLCAVIKYPSVAGFTSGNMTDKHLAYTSASNSGAYTLLGESCSERARGRAMLLCTCALMCSQATVAAFAYPILPLGFAFHIDFLGITYRPWRLLALVMSLPCAATACLLQLFHESPKFLASHGRLEEALEVLKKIYASNTGNTADSFPVKKLLEDTENQSTEAKVSFFKSVWQQTVPLFRAPLLKETVRLFYLVAVIYMTGSGFILWLPYIMNNLFFVLEAGGGEGMNLCAVIKYPSVAGFTSGNMTDVEICDDTIQNTTLFSAMTYGAMASFSNVVLSLTCGSRKRLAMISIMAMSAIAAILLNVVAEPLAGGIFFFFFLMCALSMGILSVYFVELYPTSLRGMVSCLSVMLGRMSAFLGVNAIGALISTSCEATFYGWSLLLMSAIAVAWFLPKDKAPKQ
uniref:Major facilitator superfamily (MFS) profile domain-containing protein n=1 Tax=Heliothis virescens TaxID=7102 RepID=A0A2A4JL38_HELVI